jgi:TatD DNase family protein
VIDTHAHLDACADPPEELMRRARDAGVTRVLTVGTTLEGSRIALALAEQQEGVHAIVGVHPHEAADDHDLDALARLLEDDRAVAVGETGLDYYRDYAPRDRQRRLFAAQLELAAAARKPVVIHNRAADDDVLAGLASFDGDVVLHCFSYPAALPTALERGWYVSFAGNATYKNASDLRVAASQVAAERLLVESDCPYLAPQAVRGRPNEPAFVAHTLAALADVRRVAVDELAAQVDENADRVFGLA